MALLRLRRGRRRVRLHHEDRGPVVSRSRAPVGRARAHRHRRERRAQEHRQQPQGPPQGRLRRDLAVLPLPAHAQPRLRRVGGAQLPGRARPGGRGAEDLAARFRAGARAAGAPPVCEGLQARRDGAGERGAVERRGQAARPLLQPHHVPHQRSAGRVHRLRRTRGGQGRAEVPELAGDSAVPQVAGALRYGQGESGHGLDRHSRGGGGLHRRHRAARGGREECGGHAGHRAHHAPYPPAVAPCAACDRVPLRRRRGGPARRRPGARVHRRLHDARGGQEPHRAGRRHATGQPRPGRLRGPARRRGAAEAHRERPAAAEVRHRAPPCAP